MSLSSAVLLALQGSIVLNVVALGLDTRLADVTSLLRRPWMLVRSITAMNVVMPIVAVVLWRVGGLHPAVGVALVMLSLAPVPPIMPRRSSRFGGASQLTLGLLFVAGLVTIASLPIAGHFLGRALGTRVELSWLTAAKVVVVTILAPLGVGMLVRRLAPRVAARTARPLTIASTVVLFVGAFALLLGNRKPIFELIGNGTIAAIALFVAVGLLVGHTLGGPHRDERTSLALATAGRHPGLAIAFGAANFADKSLLTAAVLLYLVTGAVLMGAYAAWLRKSETKTAPDVPASESPITRRSSA